MGKDNMAINKKIGIYPGSFDPITNGHIDILRRALKIFDEIIILVAINPNKKYLFSTQEKIQMIKEATKDMKNVKVDSTTGLSVSYAAKHKASAMVRGLRAVSDFEYEIALNATNEFIDKNIDTIFFFAHKETSFISSSYIVDLFKNKVDISALVPNIVLKKLKDKIN